MRINKYLKDKGLSTRRGADDLIAKGSVYVNGKRATLGQEVTGKDSVEIRGVKGVREQELVYIAYNKDIGILTNNDEKGGKDILSVTSFKDKSGKSIRVFPVGRLDKDSRGLILMTNDGRVTDKLLSPRFKHEKEYVIAVDKPFNDVFLTRMESGIRMDGSVTKKAHTERVSPNRFKITLTEGKKRQIRRMCEALHYDVMDLQRIRIMNVELGTLPPGEYRHLSDQEKKALLASLYVPVKETMAMAPAQVKPKPSSPLPPTKSKVQPSAKPLSRAAKKQSSRPRSASSRPRTR